MRVWPLCDVAEDDTDYNNSDDSFPEWPIDLRKTQLPLKGAEMLQQHSTSNGDGTYTISYVIRRAGVRGGHPHGV